MFDTAFFGYSELPDLIELEGKELIPLKAIRLKYNKCGRKHYFSVKNLHSLCKFLGIKLHRPVKGLYCVEKIYIQFFEKLNSLYNELKFVHFPCYGKDFERFRSTYNGVDHCSYDWQGNLVRATYDRDPQPSIRQIYVSGNTILDVYKNFMTA
jgi:hypothetical protein